MGYRVVRYFRDLQDNGYAYHEGDTFPRDGVSVGVDRILELSSVNNKQGTILIEQVTEDSKPHKYTRSEITLMRKADAQALCEEVGIDTSDKSGTELKELLIEHYGL